MRGADVCLRRVCCLAAIIFANVCFAAGDSIEVVKAEGSVTTNDPSGKQKNSVAAKSVLPPKNTLVTGPNGRVVVRVPDFGYIVLGKNSKIEIGNTHDRGGFLRQLSGLIYYAVKALKGDQGKYEVKTLTATIGIRGTRFLVVDMPDRNEIGMRKGVVSVTSPDDDFEIHRKTEQGEFEAFKQEGSDAIVKEKREFDEYKANSEREFVEYKREFSLGANRMVSFDGKRVDDRPLSGETQKDMETLEVYAEEWLKEVRD